MLKLAGDAFRLIPIDSDPLHVHTQSTRLMQGISQCLKWINKECPVGELLKNSRFFHEGRINEEEGKDSADFLDWGIAYARLSVDYTAWSNSLINAHADPQKRIITFDPPESKSKYYPHHIKTDLDWWKEEMLSSFPEFAFVKIFNDWQRLGSWTEEGFDFPANLAREHSAFPQIMSWMKSKLFPELEDSCSMGMYNVGQLRSFYSSLYVNCECFRVLENQMDREFGIGRGIIGMGTWILQMPRDSCIDWLVELTGIPHECVDQLVSDMTLDANRFHSSLGATPFVHSRSGTIFLLPNHFAYLSPQRTFAAALTTGSGRKNYEKVGNILEKYHLDQLEIKLRDHGFKVFREKRFTTPGGEKMTPDFVIYDETSSSIVVADFKNSLAAIGVAQVSNRLREYSKGINQVERYVALIEQSPRLLEGIGLFPATNVSVQGLLIFRIPMALPISIVSSVKVTDWFTLRQQIEKTTSGNFSFLIPQEISEEMQGAWQYAYEEIAVGEWTYRRSILKEAKTVQS